jgi:outer membrane receptor for ferrienterochelin and colicin
LGPNIGIRNSVDELDISAGLKGTLLPGLNFKATIYRNSVKNMPLMVSDFNMAAGYNKFKVIYDNGSARVSGFTGELDYKATEDLNIFGSAEFIDYQLASEQYAWNLPKFKLKGGASIRINDKVIVNGTLLYRGQTFDPYVSPSMQALGATKSSIDAFADVSGGVEYKVTKKITIFGQVNNILNANSQNWLYYSNYGFNIFGGASYSF